MMGLRWSGSSRLAGLFTPSVFPTVANTAVNLIGAYYGSGYLKADVDMLSIYDRPLTPTEVAQHKALTR